MARDATLPELIAALQDQVEAAEIIGVAQNQTPAGGGALEDVIELTLTVGGRQEPLVFRTPYKVLYGGGAVPDLNRFVENILRIYALPGGPGTVVPPLGSDAPPGPLPPGPVVP